MRRVVVLSAALLLGVAGCGGTRSARVPVVVDTDLSTDDAIALLYLLESPRVDVRAVTVPGTGLVHCPAIPSDPARLSTTGSTIFLCLTRRPTNVWFAAQVAVYGSG